MLCLSPLWVVAGPGGLSPLCLPSQGLSGEAMNSPIQGSDVDHDADDCTSFLHRAWLATGECQLLPSEAADLWY